MFERLLRHPIAVILGGVLIAIGGVAGLGRLPVDLFPDLNYPLINIITHYPAGTAEDMEQLITRPIENAMMDAPSLRRVRSVSAPGFSQVTVEFSWGIDVLQARQLVYARLAQVQGDLPRGARPELENIGTSLAMISTYTLSGGDPVDLAGWVRYELAPRLTSLPGVARVDVMGGGERAFRIDVDPVSLLRHHLTLETIASAVRKENVLDTSGYLEEHGREVLLRTEGRLVDLDTLKGVVVARDGDGGPITLADVATVYDGVRPKRYVITADRLPAVAFTIQKQPGASTLAVSRAVDRALGEIQLPEGTTLSKFYDQAEIIGLAYRNMRDNLLVGAFLAVLCLLWVLGWNRGTFILTVTFPFVVLGTFLLMDTAGLGINLMTLGAITVAIGMVADDAIVVLENIDRHRLITDKPHTAALRGVREILAPDVAGTLTILAAFVPLILLTGMAGRLFQPFGLTFAFVLSLSLLFSITLIPVDAAKWMSAARDSGRPTTGARILKRIEVLNHRVLDLFLAHRKKASLGVIILLLGSLTLMVFNPIRFLPLLDEDSLLLSYQLAPGTSLEESNRVGDELEREILSMKGVKGVFRRTGSPESSFYVEGPDQGEIVIRIDRESGVDALTLKARLESYLKTLPGIITRVNEPTTEKLDESFSGLPALFGITVFATDLSTLFETARLVEGVASKVPGLVNIVNNTKVPTDEIVVRPDRNALARLGISAASVANTVRTAMQGESIASVLVQQRPVDIFLRYSPQARRDVEAVSRILVPGSEGRSVPLSQVARMERHAGYPVIEHQQGLRCLTLTAEIDGNPLSVMDNLDRAIKGLNLASGIQWAYTGEYHELVRTGIQMLWVLLASVLLVYGIIAVQLGNWLDPLVVLVKLPLDFMGAALALFLTRQTLDVTVLIGFITLAGVSTNNGIMLLTFIKKFRKEGKPLMEAVREAVTIRTRPMLLTHLTTLLALIPSTIGIGAGPQLLKPLGTMLFGGLTAGTLFTLNILPVFYVMTERWRRF